MDPDEGTQTHGNAARSPRPAPLPNNTAPAMMPNPFENQGYLGFMSPSTTGQPGGSMKDPPTTFKRLIVQIGCQNESGDETEQKKRAPKIMKAISDPTMTVEDWLYDLLNSGDIANDELVKLFQHQSKIITVNYGTTSLLLSLGPNRSIPIEAIKSKKGLKCTKGTSTEETNGKKRSRKSKPKSLRIELVMSKSNVLLCPRDPIFQLIDSNEEYILQSVGEGSWVGQESAGNGVTAIAPEPVEEPPAKRQKLRKETRPPQQQPAASAKKKEKTKKQKKDDNDSKANGDRKKNAKADGTSKSSGKEGQKSKEKTPKQKKIAVDAEKNKTTSFSDQDVLLGNGKEQRQNRGNANYNKCIETKLFEWDNTNDQSSIENEVKSSFRFYMKVKGSNSWDLLQKSSGHLASKIRRDFIKLKKQKKQNGIETKFEEKSKIMELEIVDRAVTKDEIAPRVNPKKNDESATHDGDRDDLNESIIDGSSTDDSGEDDNQSNNGEGGSLSDETDQDERKKEEVEEKLTVEKADKKKISAKTSKAKRSDSEQNDKDDDSSSSSSAGSDTENEDESESESENEMEVEDEDEDENENENENKIDRKNSSSNKSRNSKKNSETKLENDDNEIPTRIVVEKSDDAGALLNQDETKNGGKLKTTGRGDEKQASSTNAKRIGAESRAEGNASDNGSDDDSSTSPSSDSSSVNSSDSSSTASSSVSSSSDDVSTSSDDDSNASEKKKKSEVSASKQLQRPKSGAKKRKPLLDPTKPLLFPDTNRRLTYGN